MHGINTSCGKNNGSSVKWIDGNRIKGLCTCIVWLSKNGWFLQRRVNYRIKGRKDKWIRCLPVSLSFRLLQTTYSQIIGICKYFYAVQSWHMLFWLLKDAWLTCNRCSISVLLTPFWSPIKHLLRTTWQPVDWLLVTSLLFARVLYICRWSVWNYVMTFQNLICISNELKRKGLCLGGRW